MKESFLARSRPRWRNLGVTAALLSAPMAVVIGTGTAQAQAGYAVSIVSPVSLQLGGQVVVVKTYVTCPAGQTVGLQTSLAQRVNSTTVLSSGNFRTVYCTGTAEKVFNWVGAPTTSLSYRSGSAIATAMVSFCDPDTGNCGSTTASKVVQVSWTQYNSGTDSAPLVTATLGANGYLRAHGAGLVVPVTVLCTSASSAGMTITVDHALKQNRVTDVGSANPTTCNPTKRSVQVLVAANAGVPFVAGPMFATADVTACDNGTGQCQEILPMRTITAS